jgi:Helix-turn-helix domain
MPSDPRQPSEPPAPTGATVRDFGASLRALREWSRVTQKALEHAHPALSDSTISDHERGVRFPRWEWVAMYVEVCVRHRQPSATGPQLAAALTPWRTTWGQLNRADSAPAPVAPATVPAAAVDAADAHPVTDHADPTPEPVAAEPPTSGAASYTPRGKRRRWIVVAVPAVVAVSGVAAAAALGAFDTSRGAPGTTTSLTPSLTPAVHANGTVEALRRDEGIDLDTNTRKDQNATGVDISFSSGASHLDAMSTRVTFALLPAAVTAERSNCEQIAEWTRTIPTIRDLAEGRNICVKTDEGRLSILTITQRANATAGTISFRFTTWS